MYTVEYIQVPSIFIVTFETPKESTWLGVRVDLWPFTQSQNSLWLCFFTIMGSRDLLTDVCVKHERLWVALVWLITGLQTAATVCCSKSHHQPITIRHWLQQLFLTSRWSVAAQEKNRQTAFQRGSFLLYLLINGTEPVLLKMKWSWGKQRHASLDKSRK